MEIIYEINYRFLEEVRKKYTKDESIISELSIIREGPEKKVKMSNLAIIGSHAINGVAELHTKILKERLFTHFFKMYPERFYNVTNGITQRRWLRAANPMLSGLITDKIGSGWIKDLSMLKKIEGCMNDHDFLENWQSAKWFNKDLLRSYIMNEHNIKVNLESIFDVQVKRFHEYKRQLLNVLHVITLYNWIKDNPKKDIVPRTVLFAGKAAPAYYMAKLVIKLINSVAGVVNYDKDVGDKLKILFLKNYSVSLAEKIIPASDLSEQISTAGFEASGTGNMKLALNGALTIGTMDGANVELREEVGHENIFIFGLHADEVVKLKKSGYNPREIYEKDEELRRVIDMIASNYFSRNEPGIFKPIVEGLLNYDYYCLFADYKSYIETQEKVSRLYSNQTEWAKKSILNSARMGKFSSDRSIKEYAEKIWKVKPMKVDVDI